MPDDTGYRAALLERFANPRVRHQLAPLVETVVARARADRRLTCVTATA